MLSQGTALIFIVCRTVVFWWMTLLCTGHSSSNAKNKHTDHGNKNTLCLFCFVQFSRSLCRHWTVACTCWWSSSFWYLWALRWLVCLSVFTTFARSLTRASEATKDFICGTALLVCEGIWVCAVCHTYGWLSYILILPSTLLIPALFGGLALLCFLAAMRHHSLSERVANFRENLFVLVIVEDNLDWSFWLGVGSVATHFAICAVVAMSRIKLSKPDIKKPEEPTISSLDMLYWRSGHAVALPSPRAE